MRFYHFTYPAAVEQIQEQGIRPSTVQVPNVGPSLAPVVSLTTNADPGPLLYKSLWDDSEYFGDVLEQYRKAHPDGPVPIGQNNVARRIVLEIPKNDKNIYPMAYPDIAALGFTDQANIDVFLAFGGGTVEEWCVYLGVVPAKYIVDVQEVDRTSLSI